VKRRAKNVMSRIATSATGTGTLEAAAPGKTKLGENLRATRMLVCKAERSLSRPSL